MAEDVDAVMIAIPERWRTHWCGGEFGPCACLGCVQIGNRAVMVADVTGTPFRGDPEYIDESKIPPEVFKRLKVTKQEWDAWMAKNHPAE